MVGPIRFDGLVSGIDFTSIIKKLLEAQRRPLERFNQRIADLTQKKTGFLTVSANLLALKSVADRLARPSFLNSVKATSNAPAILDAAAGTGAAVGSFSFRVAKIAQAHSVLSNGFADDDNIVTTTDSSIRIEVGGGFVDRDTLLSALNGNAGVDRGLIQITDSAGNSAVIDLQAAATIGDVLDAINTNTQIAVEASIQADRIVIKDLAGGAGPLTVADFGSDTTATDLGIAESSTAGVIYGADVNRLTAASQLRLLNDGLGVRRNSTGAPDFTIKFTGGTGSFAVDIAATAATIQDVLNAINNATGNGGQVTAVLGPDGTSIRLNAGPGITGISVSAAADSLAAVDLGFGRISGTTFVPVAALNSGTGAVDPSGGTILAGNRITASLNSILRNTLNGGQVKTTATDIQGVADGTITITDKLGNAATIDVSRYAATTLAAAVSGGATTISVADSSLFAVGNKVRLAGNGQVVYRTVTAVGAGTITFDQAVGVALDAGDAVYAVNESTQDLLRLINFRLQQAGVGVTVGLNAEGNGFRVVDTTGGAGTLSVTGTPAAHMGIAGSTSGTVLEGSDVDPQYIGENTLLSTLNQGRGVQKGKIRITDTDGTTFDVNLSSDNLTTVGQVIREINIAASTAGSGVIARINNTGDGILLVDTTPGTGVLKVQEVGSTRTAADLNIAGTAPSATPAQIDGAFEFVVTIKANTKVKDVVTAINNSKAPVAATLLNTADPVNPFRISVVSRFTGEAGRLVIDPQFPGLSFSTTTRAQDAALLFGADGGLADPVLIRSSSNRVTGVVQGLTLDLKSPSPATVTVTVERDLQAIVDQAQNFVEKYNGAIDTIRDLTKFDPDSFKKGILFGDGALRRIRRDLADLINTPVAEIPAGNLRTLQEVGFSIVSNGKITLDSGKLQNALETNFDQVVELFTKQRPLSIGTKLADFHRGLGVRQVDGKDFRIIKRNGEFFDVDIATADTVGDVQSLITNNPGNGGDVVFSISADGFRIELTDNSLVTRLASGGTTTSLTDTTFVGSPISFAGARITFTSGPNAGAVVTVASFNPSTGTFTFNETLGSPVAAGDQYVLERPFEVSALNNSPAAGDLGIQKRLELGADTLTGNIIVLTDAPGKMFQISDRLDFITKPQDGTISTRVDALDDRIEGFKKTVARGEERINSAEQRLIREFARLEQLIAQSLQTQQRLQAQQAGLFASMLGLGRPRRLS